MAADHHMAVPYFDHGTVPGTISPSYQPHDRSLPSQQVNEENLTDRYVQFILYCNPHFPLDIETAQLQTSFNAPPKSDGKEFETYRLFELIKQFDAKEITTWSQLAQELGVDLPDTSKGQSSQKIQQFSVRLKRWMRAMHIDAFFEYLLGKQHVYLLEIPSPNDPYPACGRDGVTAEEDLAIRALDPSFRPKRGRRRNSDVERDEENDSRAKQARLSNQDESLPFSAYPHSAIPTSAHPNAHLQDPWTAASAHQQPFHHWPSAHLSSSHSAITPSVPLHLRWQAPSSAVTPATPHPMTALPGGAPHLDVAYHNEPKSAITPSTSKRKRKHGPAVSSAWPSATPTGGRPRGRPPASRPLAAEGGPFSAFPASRLSAASTSPGAADAVEATPEEIDMPPPPIQQPQSAGGSRGHRLSLQVPQHKGGPVRLATPPPPVVTVNGGEVASMEEDGRRVSFTPESMASLPANTLQSQPTGSAQFTRETLHRVLTTELLRAQLTGRTTRLSTTEAKILADIILVRLSLPGQSNQPPSSRSIHTLISAASWLGLGDQLHVPPGAAAGSRKKIAVTRFRMSADGYEEIISPSAVIGNQSGDNGNRDGIREVFDLSWTAAQGACTGTFTLGDLSIPDANKRAISNDIDADIHNLVLSSTVVAASQIPASRLSGLHNGDFDLDALASRGQRLSYERRGLTATQSNSADPWEDLGRQANGDMDWKSRCRALEFGTMLAKGEMERFRERVVEGLLDMLT